MEDVSELQLVIPVSQSNQRKERKKETTHQSMINSSVVAPPKAPPVWKPSGLHL